MGRRVWMAIVLLMAASSGMAQSKQLAQQVTIYRDAYGTPHVFGRSDASTVFGFAYAQAEDNFPQMEENFILALGRGSEAHGEQFLEDDELNRTLEVERRAREDYEQGSAKLRELCKAFAHGVNHYLEHHAEVKPQLLMRIEPWYPLAFIRYNYYQQGFAQDPKLRSGESRSRLDDATKDRNGSNGWVIAPSRSATGHAMLLINPHLPFFGPAQIYEGHLHSDEGWEFTGYARFGFPFPYIGHNSTLGWMATDNSADMVDGYVEQFDDPAHPLEYRYGKEHKTATEKTEIIRVKTSAGMEERKFQFIVTHHGPVIRTKGGRRIAIRMAKFDSHGWVDEWYRMTKANSLKELKSAIAPLDMLFGNIMSADSDGYIFYVYNGAVPRRDPKYDWSKPVDGSDPGTEWQGYYSWGQLPHLENPATGWMQNCNTSPFQLTKTGNPDEKDYPKWMVRDGDNPRGRASMRILEGNRSFTFEQWMRAAFDTHVITADEVLPQWIEMVAPGVGDSGSGNVGQALDELRRWNHVASVDSVATTLFVNWHHAMEGEKETPDVLAAKLEGVLRQLITQFGRWQVPYGEVNRLQRTTKVGADPWIGPPKFDLSPSSLPVAGVSGYDGAIFTFNSIPFQLGKEKHRFGVHGATYISVVEFGPKAKAMSVVTFGESGNPASSHYFDQAQLYAKGQFKQSWFTREEVEQNARRKYHPGEETSEQ